MESHTLNGLEGYKERKAGRAEQIDTEGQSSRIVYLRFFFRNKHQSCFCFWNLTSLRPGETNKGRRKGSREAEVILYPRGDKDADTGNINESSSKDRVPVPEHDGQDADKEQRMSCKRCQSEVAIQERCPPSMLMNTMYSVGVRVSVCVSYWTKSNRTNQSAPSE